MISSPRRVSLFLSLARSRTSLPPSNLSLTHTSPPPSSPPLSVYLFLPLSSVLSLSFARTLSLSLSVSVSLSLPPPSFSLLVLFVILFSHLRHHSAKHELEAQRTDDEPLYRGPE